jgi:hypothetical protein
VANKSGKKGPQTSVYHRRARPLDETDSIFVQFQHSLLERESNYYQSSGQQCSAMLGCISYQTLS